MRKLPVVVAGLGLALLSGASVAQQVPWVCPVGFKPIGHVCLSADQQKSVCLYPDAAGQPRKSGTPSDTNPASCPRHPPGQNTAHPH
jgi:hypothetical protein